MSAIAKVLGFWALAGIITTVFYCIIILATGNLGDIVSFAMIVRLLDSLNPLLALIVDWVIDPLSLFVQIIIFIIILIISYHDEIGF